MILTVALSIAVAAGFVCLLVLVRVGVKPEPLVLHLGFRKLRIGADAVGVHLCWLPAMVVGNPRVIDGEVVGAGPRILAPVPDGNGSLPADVPWLETGDKTP